MRRPGAAHCRHTPCHWPTCPSNQRQRAPSGSRCRPPRREGPRSRRNAPCVQTSTTQAGQCWNTWRGTRCTLQPPADDKEAASNILQGRARRSPWHAPYARRPPPEAADHADGDEKAPRAAPGTGGAAQPGSMSIPAGLAPLAPLAHPAPRAPLWAPLGTGSADAAHPDALAAPAKPSGDADAG